MLGNLACTISRLQRIFRIRFDKSSINEAEKLIEFIHTRSAYVAQTSLYGYLKTRMGRSYAAIFKDERFAPSLNAAKWTVYAACLSDLTVYSAALIASGSLMDREETAAFAAYCHRECVRRTFEGKFASVIEEEVCKSFSKRARATIWANAAVGATAFSESPEALANSSPVSDTFKQLDHEIVTNSVRFRWNDVRNQLQRRLDGEALGENWTMLIRQERSG